MTTTAAVTATAQKPPVNHKRALRTVTIISTFGGLLFGYDTGVINGARFRTCSRTWASPR